MHTCLNICKTFVHHTKRIRPNFCHDKCNYCDDINLKLPPEPTTCCMSGCANCVWIEYAQTVTKMFSDSGEKAREIILEKISDPNMKAFLSTELRMLEMQKESTKKPEDL